MADQKLSELALKTLLPINALIHILDPNDLSQSPSGSDFKMEAGNFLTQTFRGAVDLSSTKPTLVGTYMPTVSGTYTNFGGVLIDLTTGSAIIIFDGTTYSVQKTTIDLSLYAKKTDTIDNLTSTSVTGALSPNQGKILNEKTNSIFDIATLNIVSSTFIDNQVLQSDGNATSNSNFKIVGFPVVAGKKYRILGDITSPAIAAGSAFGAYQFYIGTFSSANKIISSLVTQTANTVQGVVSKKYDLIITAPATANYIYISQLKSANTMVIAEVILSTDLKNSIVTNTTNIQKNTDTGLTLLEASKAPIISDSFIDNQVLQSDGNGVTNSNFKIVRFPVVAGKYYKIIANISSPAIASGSSFGAYQFYKGTFSGSNKIFSSLVTQTANTVQGTTVKSYDLIIQAPATARYIYISQLKTSDTATVSDIFSYSEVRTQISKVNSNIIECNGDSITWGAAPANGQYWSLLLQNLVGENYKVLNAGVGGETAVNIPARQGAIPMYNSLPINLPADLSTVQVGTMTNSVYDGFFKSVYDDLPCLTLLQGGGRDFDSVNPLIIDGIECTLSITITQNAPSPINATWNLRRNVLGTARNITVGNVVTTNQAKNIKPGFQVIWMGTNGGFQTVDELIDKIKRMISFSRVGTNYCVLTPYAGSGNPLPVNFTTADFVEMERKFRKEFGIHYFNPRKYAIEKGLSDAGITPTSQDNTNIADGKVPPSLLADGIHPNNEFSVILAQQIFNVIKRTGFINA